MPAERFAPAPEELDLLDRVARAVARSRRLSPADVEDFAQAVHLRMADRQYEAFRRFEGRATLRTYLTVVVARLLKDWQNHEYGKWRPSAAARRLGPVAIALDRELNRDRCPRDEAVQLVASRTGCPEAGVQALAEGLSRRGKRRLVSLEAAGHLAVPFVDPVAGDQRGRALAAAGVAVRRALRAVPAGDARLFLKRYQGRQTVATLAVAANVDAKALYRRFELIRRALRDHLEAGGIRDARCADQV